MSAKKNQTDEIALHLAGATVRHINPFEEITIPRNEHELPADFIEKWVHPFYSANLLNSDDLTIKKFASAAKEINITVVNQLLGDFNWRTRITAAYFAAINNYKELDEIIGGHLLKSEVCYAGSGYCLALATFGNDNAKNYLVKYLEYYLDRKDLWFDQGHAFCALEYLDKTSSEKLINKWNEFVSDKDNWDLKKTRNLFLTSMSTLNKIRQT